MSSKGVWLFWVAVVNAVLFVTLAAPGIILNWGLPPGSGGGGGRFRGAGGPGMRELWGLTRHEWGDVHFWIAMTMVAAVMIHLVLLWGWIKTASRRNLLPVAYTAKH